MSVAGCHVTFCWRDSAHHNKQKLMTLSETGGPGPLLYGLQGLTVRFFLSSLWSSC